MTGAEEKTAEALRARAVLLGLSYRLLGSLSDAEDAVQEAYVRWYRLTEDERRRISSPRAWLITTVGRIGLDLLGSARARREQYAGEWLPEPMPERWSTQHDDASADPADRVALDDSVSMALLVVLESMTPAERVAFVLHDVFRFTFAEVGEVVGRSPEACRQLASSARRRVRQGSTRPVDDADHAAVVRSFKEAWRSGDLAGLVGLLDPAAVAITDGGGLVSASLEPLRGADAIGRFLVEVLDRQPDLVVHEETVNGAPGLVATSAGRALAVISLALRDGLVESLWAVRNPDKLQAWNRA